jgi:hypothetical protein
MTSIPRNRREGQERRERAREGTGVEVAEVKTFRSSHATRTNISHNPSFRFLSISLSSYIPSHICGLLLPTKLTGREIERERERTRQHRGRGSRDRGKKSKERRIFDQDADCCFITRGRETMESFVGRRERGGDWR